MYLNICINVVRRITNGNSLAAEVARVSVRLGRSLPRLTPITLCQPWSCFASPYLSSQNVSYLERYMQVFRITSIKTGKKKEKNNMEGANAQ